MTVSVSGHVGSVTIKIVQSYLTDDWQTVDEISESCCGMSRRSVQIALQWLHESGIADRKYAPVVCRKYLYRLAQEESA